MMSRNILYLGDTAIDQSAGYLAGVMAYYKIEFDYLASNKKFSETFLKNNYKAIVISDYPAGNFSEFHIQAIAEKIKNGTGFLMIGGWDSFVGQNGKYNNTLFKEVLPVMMENKDDRINCSAPCMVVRNCRHEITDGLPFETDAPAIGGFNNLKAKKNCTEILSARKFTAEFKAGKFDFTELKSSPLLVAGQFGRGNVAAFASDVAPHWVGPLVDWGNKRITAKSEGGSEIEVGNWYAQLFINIIRWISKENTISE